MANVPEDLKYTESHEWVRSEEDGTVTIGITDYAQSSLGDVVHLELPKLGSVLEANQDAAVVESVKAASDIYAPVGGEVIAINEELSKDPAKLNEDAYAAWLFKLKPSNPADMDDLLSALAYSKETE